MIMKKQKYITPQSDILRVVTKSGICDFPFHPQEISSSSAWSGGGETSPDEAPRRI